MIPAIINPARVPNTMPTTADAHHGRPVARPVIQPSPTMDEDHASEPAPDSHRNTGQRIPPIPAAAIDASLRRNWMLTSTAHNTKPTNYTGHPALAVPCGKVKGMPISLQLVGRFLADPLLLQVAYAESTFLLLLFGALLALVRRRYWLIAPLGVVAAFTKPGVLALAVAILALPTLLVVLPWWGSLQHASL